MSKTIKEAARDYAYYIGDSDWEHMRLRDAFVDGTNYIMQLPLSSRLTTDEKERVRRIYKELKSLMRSIKIVYPDGLRFIKDNISCLNPSSD